jgi:hypothetical protein
MPFTEDDFLYVAQERNEAQARGVRGNAPTIKELEEEVEKLERRVEELREKLESSLPPDFDYQISRAVTRRDWEEVELVLHRYRVGFF